MTAETQQQQKKSQLLHHFQQAKTTTAVHPGQQIQMPPKKRQKTDSGNARPADFVSKSKDTLLQKLKKEAASLDEENDYDRLVESVRALIQTNSEIWERCLPNKFKSEKSPNSLQFHRIGYSNIKVTTSGVSSDPKVFFKTIAEISTQQFMEIPDVPETLQEIFAVEKKESFPNYECYLEKAVCLEPDLSKHFLTILKEHLKAVQVALGGIESWLWEPSHAQSFIHEHFQQNLAAPKLSTVTICGWDCRMTHEPSSLCVHCFQPFRAHTIHPTGAHQSCPEKFTNPEFYSAGFLSPYDVVTLKTVPMPFGEVKMTFNVCSESERDRLKRFIHFLDPGESKP
jgi:hypothetical protein